MEQKLVDISPKKSEYNTTPKLKQEDVDRWEKENGDTINQLFGDWFSNDISTLADDFKNAKPYQHIVIKNFLAPSVIEKVVNQFPQVDSRWHSYKNFIELKFAFDDLEAMPSDIKDIFFALSTHKFIDKLGKITSIKDLEFDQYLHGAGLHAHPRNGRLEKQRRLNLILYVNKNWKEEYNGAIELWKPNMSECEKKVYPELNVGVIFATTGSSFHGLADKLQCPEGEMRKSIAYYWISPIEKGPTVYRKKAKFVKRPMDLPDDRKKQLYEIRAERRITEEDIQKIWPDWDPETD